MNANELADELEDKDRLWNVDENLMIKTCAMLRQQQAEIKDLKQQVSFLEDWRDTWAPFLKAIREKINES